MSSPQDNRVLGFKEIGERPYVRQYVEKPKFKVRDKVFLIDANRIRTGPYVIASLPSNGKCTLSLEDGSAVNNGAEIAMHHIMSA